ncbi:hypothetical protein [Streptomyces liangshanensis]|uniref:hypothetical protein n=1 Tax=Streptomyces liangshanensis TaxID=2717324 RepID=UPI0036DEF4C0
MRAYHFLAGEKATATKMNLGEMVGWGVLAANAPTTASTTEVAVISATGVTLRTGRAYQFELRGLLQHASASTTDLVAMRLRRTSTTGTLIRNWGSQVVSNRGTVSRNNFVNLSHIGANDTGSDLVTTVLATYSWDTGSTSTFTFAATVATPATLAIFDIGPSSDYPGIGPIT